MTARRLNACVGRNKRKQARMKHRVFRRYRAWEGTCAERQLREIQWQHIAKLTKAQKNVGCLIRPLNNLTTLKVNFPSTAPTNSTSTCEISIFYSML